MTATRLDQLGLERFTLQLPTKTPDVIARLSVVAEDMPRVIDDQT